MQNHPMIYGYARVSTDGQSVDAQVKQLRAVGAGKVYRDTASGAKTERAQLRRVLAQLDAGDVLIPAGAIDARPTQYACYDRRQECRLPLAPSRDQGCVGCTVVGRFAGLLQPRCLHLLWS
jgi:Resolvase, N terminal domain